MENVEDTTGLCRLIMLRKSWDIFSFSLKLLAFLIHSSKTLTTQIVVFCGNLLWITEGQDWHLLQLLTRGLLGAFKGWGQKWAFFVSPTALVLQTWKLARSFLAVGMFENCWPWASGTSSFTDVDLFIHINKAQWYRSTVGKWTLLFQF